MTIDPNVKDWIETTEHVLGILTYLGAGVVLKLAWRILKSLHTHGEKKGVLHAEGVTRLFEKAGS